MADKLIFYSSEHCPVSLKAKAALVERGEPFEERCVDDDVLWQEDVIRLTGMTLVPVFVRDGQVEIGWEGEDGCHF
ncbi:MAG: hypothetical protein HY329_13540 [Chloroflexi bacterium]|nr:hypothetical protein [Chloroflexota bacterium]